MVNVSVRTSVLRFSVANWTLKLYKCPQNCKADAGRIKHVKLGANSGLDSVL